MIRRSAVLTASLVALCLGLEGCISLFPKATPAQLYRFGDDRPLAPPRQDESRLRAVIVDAVQFPRAATSDGILTVSGAQTAYVAGARWVAPARVLFQEALERQFATRTSKTRLVSVGDPGLGALILRVTVIRFEADYAAPGEPPRIRIELTAHLSSPTGASLDQRVFLAEKAALSNTVSGLVGGFNAASDAAVEAVGAWADEAAARAPPPPATASVQTTTTSTSTSTSTSTAIVPEPTPRH